MVESNIDAEAITTLNCKESPFGARLNTCRIKEMGNHNHIVIIVRIVESREKCGKL